MQPGKDICGFNFKQTTVICIVSLINTSGIIVNLFFGVCLLILEVIVIKKNKLYFKKERGKDGGKEDQK